MIPKGVLLHAEIPRDIKEWKIPTSKLGQFWPKTLDLNFIRILYTYDFILSFKQIAQKDEVRVRVKPKILCQGVIYT